MMFCVAIKKEQATDTCNSVSEYDKYYAMGKKPDTEENMLYCCQAATSGEVSPCAVSEALGETSAWVGEGS